MRRFLFIVCASVTLALVVLIIDHRKVHSNRTQRLEDKLVQAAKPLYSVKTQQVGLQEFIQAIREQTGTNLNDLSESQREKLSVFFSRFYSCYFTGKYEEYQSFRLHPPYTISKKTISFVKDRSSKNKELESDEAILRTAWDILNGTNRISQVDENSIRLAIVTTSDLGLKLRVASDAKQWPAISTATCSEGTVVYQPTVAQLLKKEGKVQYVTLEFKGRFNFITDGPAMPLVLEGYWYPTRDDWMPYACVLAIFSFSIYDTMF